jgi:pantothenate kinase
MKELPEDLVDDLTDELSAEFLDLDIEEMVEVIDDISDRYQHRELHFICTGTDALVIYDRQSESWLQIEKGEDTEVVISESEEQ